MVRMILARGLLVRQQSPELAGRRIEQQAVDGEVAALDIFLRTLAETHLVGMAAIAVADVTAEGGDFDHVAVTGRDFWIRRSQLSRYECPAVETLFATLRDT